MKKITCSKFGILILTILFAFSISNCTVKAGVGVHTSPPPSSHKTKKIPPGQAKKANGDQSAKKYAPGHNK